MQVEGEWERRARRMGQRDLSCLWDLLINITSVVHMTEWWMREGDTESEAGSRLRAVSTEPHVELELTDREIMTWAEVRRPTNWATQVPQGFVFDFKSEGEGGTWAAQSVEHLTLWFRLRSWSKGRGIELRVRLCTECEACLGFSLSLSLSQPLPHSLSLKINKL